MQSSLHIHVQGLTVFKDAKVHAYNIFHRKKNIRESLKAPQLSSFQKKQGQTPLKEISRHQCLSNCEIVLNLSESLCISKSHTLDP